MENEVDLREQTVGANVGISEAEDRMGSLEHTNIDCIIDWRKRHDQLL